MISKVRREEILRNLEEGKYKNAFLNLRSELDFIETEIEKISLFELQDFREKHYSPEVLLERYNNWRTGNPENIPKKNNPERDGEPDKIPKKKLAPEHKKKLKKNTNSLPTIQEEDEEVEVVKGKEREKSPLTTPLGYRNSKRFNRKDYRGMC